MPPKTEYSLTELGKTLVPLIHGGGSGGGTILSTRISPIPVNKNKQYLNFKFAGMNDRALSWKLIDQDKKFVFEVR